MPEELPPSVEGGGKIECDLCNRKFPAQYLLDRHKYGHFSKHKLDRATGQPLAKKGAKEAIKPDVVTPGPKRQAKPVVKTGPRKPADRVLAFVWGAAANVLMPRVSPRAAMIMQWQSVAAGPALDKMLAGSFIDRQLLQRVAGGGDRYRNATALLSLPMLVAIAENQPVIATQPVFIDMARRAIRVNYEAILDAQIKEKEEEAKFEAKAEEAGLELTTMVDGQYVKVNPIDGLFNEMFGFAFAAPVPTEHETVAA